MTDSTISSTTLVHVAQVVGVNLTALTITFAEFNSFLTTISLVLASGYTIYKFIKDIKSGRKPKSL